MLKIEVVNPSQELDRAEEMTFLSFPGFGSGGTGAFWSGAGGISPWEMHPDCDELLHVMEGEVDVEVLPADGGEACMATVRSGCFLIVPRGCWHRQYIRKKSSEFYVTPGQTLHSQSEDPRLNV